MLRQLLAAGVACLALAACGTALPSPSAGPSGTQPVVATSAPSASSAPSTSPGETPKATQAPEASPLSEPTRAPDEAWSGNAAAALRNGVRDDIAATCEINPSGLPRGVLAELRCRRPSDGIALVTLRVYASRWQLLDAWDEMIAARGIEPVSHSGRCLARHASEGGYVPGDGHGIEVAERSACWLGGDGAAHYLAMVPSFVLVRVDGLDGTSIRRLEAWAWLGNRDQPGGPTLWRGRP